MGESGIIIPAAPALEEIRESLASGVSPTTTKHTFQLKLVTPMFGGGVEAARIDPDQPFRPSAIRGQLRFWWRATEGARYETVEDLFEAESKIWGTTDQSSRVRIRVRVIEKGKTDAGWELKGEFGRPSDPAYVHFLVSRDEINREQETNAKTARRLLTGKFDLAFEFHNLKKEEMNGVSLAIRAWILFGGIGARSRRGCGTLWPEPMKFFNTDAPAASFVKFFQTLPGGDVRPWPTLKGAKLFLGNAGSSPQKVWEDLIRRYSEFRQQRNPGNPHPKRSHWPEPDAIRKLTGRRAAEHPPFPNDPMEFPRSLLGLPIITHFKDRGEPPDTSLEATDRNGAPVRRHASPLILKVLPLGNGQALPMVLCLNTDIVQRLKGNLDLRAGRRSVADVLTTGPATSPLDIRATSRALAKNIAGQPYSLREWFTEKHGFQEVKL